MPSVTYSSGSGTVSLPANVDVVTLTIWGGGGGGSTNGGAGYGGAGGTCSFNARGKTSYTYAVGSGGIADPILNDYSDGDGTYSTFYCGNLSIGAGGGPGYLRVYQGAPSVGVTDPSNLISSQSFSPGGAPTNGTYTYPDGSTGGQGTSYPQTYGQGGNGDPNGSSPGNPGIVIVSYTVITTTVPGPPTSVTATAGAGQATVSWTAPTNTGGSAIIDYTVTSSPGGLTATTSGTSATVIGLTGGTSYTFTVTARNSVGSSSPSSPSNSVTVISFLYFSQPLSLSQIATAGGVSKSMSALRGKTVYNSGGVTTTVPATGNYGLSLFSGKTFRTPATVPNIVDPINAIAGNAQVTLSWSAPNNGGSPIIDYTVTDSGGLMNPSSVTTTNTTVIITGLTNNISYIFGVTARNSVGSSPINYSGSVTPVAPVNTLKITTGILQTATAQYPTWGPFLGSYPAPPSFTDKIATIVYVDNQYYYALRCYFTMSNGNSSPVYIYFDINSFTGQTSIILNNVNYGNKPHIAVYFPYGIVNAFVYLQFAPNGGTFTISNDPPSDYASREKGYQNASGNAITWP